jgi:hypothetical protein
MRVNCIARFLTAAVAALAFAGGVGFQVAKGDLVPNVTASASSELVGGFDRAALHLVDGSGLDAGGGHTLIPDGFMWLSTGNGCCGGAADPAPVLTFDLGKLYDLTSMRVWNYNESQPGLEFLLNRGIANADISVAGEDLSFSPLIVGQEFEKAPGTVTDFSQSIALNTSARYVRLDNMVHIAGADNDFFGLSEVQFDATNVDPPPPVVLPLPASIHSVSSNLVGFNRPAVNTVNGSGLTPLGTHTVTPDGFMWLNQGNFPTVPSDQFDTDPFIVWDVGSAVPLGTMKLWNYNEFLPGRDDLLNRGIRLADLSVAGEDLVFIPLIQALELEIAPGLSNVDFSQLIDLGGVVARYIRLDNMENYGNADNFVGLSEVQFFAVPEPSSMIGFGLMAGLMAIRRKRA